MEHIGTSVGVSPLCRSRLTRRFGETTPVPPSAIIPRRRRAIATSPRMRCAAALGILASGGRWILPCGRRGGGGLAPQTDWRKLHVSRPPYLSASVTFFA
nr:hypothetical protein Iba_chr10dCG0270 [Ipomoea batatas]GME08667.1 hypothetical protein Iba_scaffold7939CG0060 [Ipomoea batatas]